MNRLFAHSAVSAVPAMAAAAAVAHMTTLTVATFADPDRAPKAAVESFQQQYPEVELKIVSRQYGIHRWLNRSRNAVVAAYFVPCITPGIAMAPIFTTPFSKDQGVLKALLGTQIDRLGDATWTKPSVAFVIFRRRLGWNVALYLSALQVIDNEQYETATLDGAGSRQQFRFIASPPPQPMILFAVMLTIIGNLQLFEEPFILVDPEKGVSQSVMTAAVLMYRLAFSDGDFLIIAALTWGNSRLFGRTGGTA